MVFEHSALGLGSVQGQRWKEESRKMGGHFVLFLLGLMLKKKEHFLISKAWLNRSRTVVQRRETDSPWEGMAATALRSSWGSLEQDVRRDPVSDSTRQADPQAGASSSKSTKAYGKRWKKGHSQQERMKKLRRKALFNSGNFKCKRD